MLQDLFSHTNRKDRSNYSSITALSPVNVTSHEYHTVYSYSKWKLWLPYGIAILSAGIAVCVGLSAMVLSGAAYSDSFSTVFRYAKGAETSVHEILTEDLDGRDPLPKYLGNSSVLHRAHGDGEKGNAAYKQLQVPNSTIESSSQSFKHNSAWTTTRPIQRSNSRTMVRTGNLNVA